jgi:hypothetical protein
MMTQTITGLFNTYAEGKAAVEELRGAGISDNDISIVANNGDDGYATAAATNAGDDAGKGAGIGAVLGGAGGVLTGLGLMAIPGVGPVVAAGWLVATAAGAVAGGAVGAAAGGLIGAMTDNGIPERDAHIYAESVRRGGALVTARVNDVDAPTARGILSRSNVDLAAREKAFRDEGWTGFDEAAPAYTRDQIMAERDRYPVR